MEIKIYTLFAYIVGIVVHLIISLCKDDSWKYNNVLFVIFYPAILLFSLKDLFIKFNKYLTQHNLKQMNFKILGKAMSFMLLPTLSVLLVLLVGFFDPIAMWNWIKSDSFWAIITRLVIFILEIGLVTSLYFNYLEEDNKKKEEILKQEVLDGKHNIPDEIETYYNKSIYSLWDDLKTDVYYNFCYNKTIDPNIIIIERKPKKK